MRQDPAGDTAPGFLLRVSHSDETKPVRVQKVEQQTQPKREMRQPGLRLDRFATPPARLVSSLLFPLMVSVICLLSGCYVPVIVLVISLFFPCCIFDFPCLIKDMKELVPRNFSSYFFSHCFFCYLQDPGHRNLRGHECAEVVCRGSACSPDAVIRAMH